MSLLCKTIARAGNFFNLLHNVRVLRIGKKFVSTGKRNSQFGVMKLSLIGVSVGAVIGTGYSIYKLNKTTTHLLDSQTVVPVLKQIPRIRPSKRIHYIDDESGLELTLFQYQTCPFCCKVRAYLDYYGITYDVIEVDPVLRQAIKWSDYKKVPILLVKVDGGYQPLNDSSMIMSALTTYLQDRSVDFVELAKYYPLFTYKDENGNTKRDIMNKYFVMMNSNMSEKSKDELEEERKWRKWVDDVLVHMLSPNVYRTMKEAIETFEWFSEAGDWDRIFPTWERLLIIYFGAFAMWIISKRLKKKYHLNDDVRQSLYEESNRWAITVKEKGLPFLGGHKPNLADLSVYGVLSSIEGCSAFKDLLDNSSIEKWYFAVKQIIQSSNKTAFAAAI